MTECRMTSLGREHAICTSRGALLEVENFGNDICICGQDKSHLGMNSQHGTKARRAKSAPAGTKKIGSGLLALFLVLGLCLLGFYVQIQCSKVKKILKKKIAVSSERNSENN